MADGARSDRLVALRGVLDRHVPASPREVRSLKRINALLDWLPFPFDEDADPTHLTASAIVIDGAGRTLLHRHRRLGIWLQPGGHIDPGEAPAAAARRETLEETGLPARHPGGGPELVHVDVHPAGRGHLHLDLRYLLEVDEGVEPDPPDHESQDVGWFEYASAARLGDLSFADALARVSGRSGDASW